MSTLPTLCITGKLEYDRMNVIGIYALFGIVIKITKIQNVHTIHKCLKHKSETKCSKNNIPFIGGSKGVPDPHTCPPPSPHPYHTPANVFYIFTPFREEIVQNSNWLLMWEILDPPLSWAILEQNL